MESLAAEPEQVAEAAAQLKLSYVVITSVNRDELADGGAAHFARTIQAVRRRLGGAKIEVLTPDFKGDSHALHTVLDAGPDTFNHNVETVPRLYRTVRPQADYQQSLDVLREAHRYSPDVLTKSGFMVGLGERGNEVERLLEDLRAHAVSVATIGQYLQPTRAHLPVAEYVDPDVFDEYREYGERLGFRHMFSGPLVRSSFMAETVREIADCESRIAD